MTTDAELAAAFLETTDWREGTLSPLAGDASNRRYERVHKDGQPPAVLMDAPPDKGEDVRPFSAMARHLKAIGLSAPEIYAQDVARGFLLLEDLGDALYARMLEDAPKREAEIYIAAADALIVAQTATPPKLAPYDVAAMTQTALLLTDWYLPHGTGTSVPASLRAQYESIVGKMLADNMTGKLVLVQRDFHAENLLWLPDRDGAARVGLLDFQDAMLGHPAYDLASLLKDARRDVSADTQARTLDHFIAATGADPDAFHAAYAACSAQRNLRILGVFARLCVRDKKPSYPDLMPRVWGNLMDDLAHPALADLAAFIAEHVPPPTPELIARIKAATGG